MSGSSSANEPGPLGVQQVLVGSLPASLMTSAAPARYTVEAVFTRKLERDEVAAIESEDTRRFLEEQGFPGVALHVSDRRLEIRNTNLEELNSGLSRVIANYLAEVAVLSSGLRATAAAEAKTLARRELKRAAAVAALAGTVVFEPGPVQARPIQVWDNEGGASSTS
ncbi:hypothetical protein PTQ19_11135 [Microbacterium esteraromaticum]|uniref:hypothetical protein n=1 Tax=Microbacterium esteraromaticum TaxID=57043 RepID=UPI00236890F9|nr:hypothetical protein [Microbacterium esteraromaticum]WDH78075.1 hypothetical protein PTQ19_11135 [Microbacterium esteraromaticum]